MVAFGADRELDGHDRLSGTTGETIRELDELVVALIDDPDSMGDGIVLYDRMSKFATMLGGTEAEIDSILEADYHEGLVALAVEKRCVSEAVIKRYR